MPDPTSLKKGLPDWQVADFGLSRELRLASRVETTTYGTVTHMPPELLAAGELSAAADVYAFGVLLNEMYCGAVNNVSLDRHRIVHRVEIAVQWRRQARHMCSDGGLLGRVPNLSTVALAVCGLPPCGATAFRRCAITVRSC